VHDIDLLEKLWRRLVIAGFGPMAQTFEGLFQQ